MSGIHIARDGDRLVITLPWYGSDPCVPESIGGVSYINCTPEGALDLVRALASALGREDIVRLAFEENATGPTPPARDA